MRNRDRIVSKDELIETIWNGRIISEAALSSRINGARRALGDTGADQALIRTLHKRGFRFVGDVQTIDAADTDAKAARIVPGTALHRATLRPAARLLSKCRGSITSSRKP